MVAVCLRVDDIYGQTPVWLLREVDERVWAGRPVVLGMIPFAARGCLGERAGLRESFGQSRASLVTSALLEYVDDRRAGGLVEIAVHGVTRANHRSPAGSVVAELVAPSAARVERLMVTLRLGGNASTAGRWWEGLCRPRSGGGTTIFLLPDWRRSWWRW